MNTREALMLCKYTQACCPQQKFDEFTPDAWGDLLANWRYEDCKLAVANIARRQPFVAPAEIIAEVRRIRRERLDAAPPLDPPPGLNALEQIGWLKQQRERIADGEPYGLPALPVAQPGRLGGSDDPRGGRRAHHRRRYRPSR